MDLPFQVVAAVSTIYSVYERIESDRLDMVFCAVSGVDL